MASDRFQMINILLYAMIDVKLIQLFWFLMNCWMRFFCLIFKSVLSLDFACLVSADKVRRIYLCSRPSISPSILSAHTLCPSQTISQYLLVRFESFFVLAISYKFLQNWPLSTWVLALLLVKAIIMRNLYQLFCMMIFIFHQSYYI